jgi:hypothetical protein
MQPGKHPRLELCIGVLWKAAPQTAPLDLHSVLEEIERLADPLRRRAMGASSWSSEDTSRSRFIRLLIRGLVVRMHSGAPIRAEISLFAGCAGHLPSSVRSALVFGLAWLLTGAPRAPCPQMQSGGFQAFQASSTLPLGAREHG